MPSSSAQLPCSLWPAADCELSWTRDAGIVSPSAASLLVTELTTTFLLLMGFRAGPTWPLPRSAILSASPHKYRNLTNCLHYLHRSPRQ
jgi:hypothetical protein